MQNIATVWEEYLSRLSLNELALSKILGSNWTLLNTMISHAAERALRRKLAGLRRGAPPGGASNYYSWSRKNIRGMGEASGSIELRRRSRSIEMRRSRSVKRRRKPRSIEMRRRSRSKTQDQMSSVSA